MPPRTWRRPFTSIYNDNYKYGNSLYSGTLDSIEKKYHDTIRQTHMRSDRPDLTMSTFQGSGLVGGPMPSTQSEPIIPPRLRSSSPTGLRGSRNPESMMSSMLQTSLSDNDIFGSEVRRPRSFNEYDTGYMGPSKSALLADEILSDIEDRKARRKRRRRNDRSDFMDQIAEEASHNYDNSYMMDKCRDLQFELEQVSQTVTDTENRIKSEVSGAKNKIHAELTELALALDASNQQNSELQKVIKKQAKQVLELQSNYEGVQRHLQDSMEQLNASHRRCQLLKSEIDKVRSSVEHGSSRRL